MDRGGVFFWTTIGFVLCELADANQPLASFGAKRIGDLSGSRTQVRDTNHGGGNNDPSSLQNGGNCWAFGAAAIAMAKVAAEYKRQKGRRMGTVQFAQNWVKHKDEMASSIGRGQRQDGGTLQEGKRWLDSKGIQTNGIRNGAPTAQDFHGSVALDIAYSGGQGGGHIVAAYSYDMAKKMGIVGAPKKKRSSKRRSADLGEASHSAADEVEGITERTDRYLSEKNHRPTRTLARSKNVAYIIDSSKEAGVYEIALDTGTVYGLFPDSKAAKTQRFGETTLKSFFGSVSPIGFFSANIR